MRSRSSLHVCLVLILGLIGNFPWNLQSQKTSEKLPVATAMRNVHYHFTDSILIDIRWVDGRLVAEGAHDFPIFDDANSFRLVIDSANMAITADAITHLLNEYTFAAHDAPLKKLTVSITADKVKVKGSLHTKGDIPFETEGTLAATDDGKIRIHATKIRAAHLPAKGIMDLFGIEIADLVKTNKVPGLTVEKDDLILDPQHLFPPPAIEGKVSAVTLHGDSIVMTFGNSKATAKPPLRDVANYMAYRGGTLRFGKLTMSDTDMILIDENQRDPFDIYLSHYKEQLVAGYSKTTRENGLLVYMPDHSTLKHGARNKVPAK